MPSIACRRAAGHPGIPDPEWFGAGVARNKTVGIVSQNSRTDFTLTSPGSQTLPLDSGSALVEAREKKTAQGTASMPATVALHTWTRPINTGIESERHNAVMPNIASILKAEISRVARKEVRAEIETLKKASVAHRASIAELRRQVNALEKELRRVAKGATRSAAVSVSDDEAAAGTKRRFSATRLAAHRAKLGLPAAIYGQLVGVSGQTIYHWEQGKARPRAAQLENLGAVRELGAREIAERLSAL